MSKFPNTFKYAALAASLFFSAACFAQKPVMFKMEYLPQRQYNMGINMRMDMVMDVKGDSAATIRASSNGALPMKMLSNTYMDIVAITGKRQTNAGKFSLKIKYNKLDSKQSMNGTEMPSPANPLNGMEITGWAGGQALFEVDTTSKLPKVPGLDAAVIGKMMNSMMQQIKFPTKPMQVGESFDQSLDMAIPVPGMPMKFEGKTTYKLIAVNNGIADFDMIVSGAMNMKPGDSAQQITMNAKMAGTGKLKFNEAQHFFTDMTNDMNMQYDMLINKMTMTGDMEMQSTYKVTIVPVGAAK